MIKLGRSETITHTFHNDDGAIDAGVVTVTVKDGKDVVLHEDLATVKSDPEPFKYSFVLPSPADLQRIKLEWSGSLSSDTTYEEVVGDYLFEIHELRTLMASRGFGKSYDSSVLREIRDAVTETFESVTNRSFVPRQRTELVGVYGGAANLKRVDVRQVLTVDGAAFTGAFTTYGCLSGLAGSSASVTYVYGLDATAEARANALDLAVYLVGAQTRSRPDNAESMTDNSGNTYRLAMAGMRGIEVSVPHVDAFLKRMKFEMPGVA